MNTGGLLFIRAGYKLLQGDDMGLEFTRVGCRAICAAEVCLPFGTRLRNQVKGVMGGDKELHSFITFPVFRKELHGSILLMGLAAGRKLS